MIGRIFAVLMMSFLSACGGGGGGGGGGSSPSNLNPPGDGTTTPDMQTGVFSDSPVKGLRFVQGNHSGYTDTQGQFTYDANQSAPVQFFIGDLYLGSAPGAVVVTPFDLSINGTPVTLDGGVNISRVLISLDSDNNPDNGIALSDDTRNANVQLEFGLSTGQFEADTHVNYLLEQYAAGRTLESVADTRSHLSQNVAAQQRIEQLEEAIDSAISSIDIRWNRGLSGEGILAHFNASNGEELILQLAEQDDTLWIQRVIYAGPQGVSRLIEFSQDGNVAYVDNNGAVGKYVQIAEMDVIRFVQNRDIYRPQATAFLTMGSGLASAQQVHHFHQARIDDIAAILKRQSEGQIGFQDQLLMGAHFMSLFNSVSCAGVAQCNQRFLLSGALSRAMDDGHYRDATVTTHDEALNEQLCIGSMLSPVASPCLTNQTLAALLLQSGIRVQALRDREGAFVERFQQHWNIYVQTSGSMSSYLDAIDEQRYFGPWTEHGQYLIVEMEAVYLSDTERLITVRSIKERSENPPQRCEVTVMVAGEDYRKRCTPLPPAVAAVYRDLLDSEIKNWLRHSVVVRDLGPSAHEYVAQMWCAPYLWESNRALRASDCEDIYSLDEEKTALLENAILQSAGNARIFNFRALWTHLELLSTSTTRYMQLWSSIFYEVAHPDQGTLEVSFGTIN